MILRESQAGGGHRLSVPECKLMFFSEEAEKCRNQALAYVGKPEAPFLLKVARVFDELAVDHPVRPEQRRKSPSDLPLAL